MACEFMAPLCCLSQQTTEEKELLPLKAFINYRVMNHNYFSQVIVPHFVNVCTYFILEPSSCIFNTAIFPGQEIQVCLFVFFLLLS